MHNLERRRLHSSSSARITAWSEYQQTRAGNLQQGAGTLPRGFATTPRAERNSEWVWSQLPPQMKSAICAIERQQQSQKSHLSSEGVEGSSRSTALFGEARCASDRLKGGDLPASLAAGQALLAPRSKPIVHPHDESRSGMTYDPLERNVEDYAIPARVSLEHFQAFKVIRSRPIIGGRGGIPTLQAMGWQRGLEPVRPEKFVADESFGGAGAGALSKEWSSSHSSQAGSQSARRYDSKSIQWNGTPSILRMPSKASSSASTRTGSSRTTNDQA